MFVGISKSMPTKSCDIYICWCTFYPIQIQWLRPDEPALELDSNAIEIEAHERIPNPKGLKHLMIEIPIRGRFERVTGSPEQTDEALKTDNAFWIYTRGPYSDQVQDGTAESVIGS